MSEILAGAWDCHVHTAPDVTARKRTDLEMAEQWHDSGMKGGVIKSHFSDTTGRAAILQALYPDMKIYGGLVLNKQAGGLNPDAVERMAQAGGRCLWMPTMDSAEYRKMILNKEADADPNAFLHICDRDGRPVPRVYDILDIAAKYDLVLGTGHIGQRESVPLVKEAFRRGVRRVVLTHAENPRTYIDIETQKELVRLGAVVEHSYFCLHYQWTSWEEVVAEIRAVGVENILPDTDFGQPKSPDSAEGIEMFMTGLMQRGFNENEIDLMFRKNPECFSP